MILGCPKEIKVQEGRVALVPAGVHALVRAGHEVLVERGAGEGAGLDDEAYERAGARLTDAGEVWREAALVVKVKEPLESEWGSLRPGLTLFTYFHFAASRALTEAMLASGAHCFAYEALEVPGEGLPLLTPMSEVAGRMSIQVGAQQLEAPAGGAGVLLGGVPGIEPGRVTILGGGVVGTEAARMAAGLGARVVVLDIDLDRLRELSFLLAPNVVLLHASPWTIREQLPETDLLVGAVLIKGRRAPTLVRRADLALMRRGSVIVDVAVDQGGCIETCKPTTHEEPTFDVDGVIHYCVANMPGAVPRSSTFALTSATLPWIERLAALGPVAAVHDDLSLATAASVVGGKLTDAAVASSFDMAFVDAKDAC